MSCKIIYGSCSLCPYIDTPNCLKYTDTSDDVEGYYLYALNRKDSSLDTLYVAKTKKAMIDKLNKLRKGEFHKKWAKKYTVCYNLKENDKGPYVESSYHLPIIELLITNGDGNYDTYISLLFDINTGKLSYYNDIGSDITYTGKIPTLTKWDNKLIFK